MNRGISAYGAFFKTDISCKPHLKQKLDLKVTGLQFYQKETPTQHRCFPVNIVKFLGTAFFKEHLVLLAASKIWGF